MTGRFIAIVGASGVGKDSVMAALGARDARLSLVRRVITRPSTAGGEDFDGVDDAAFDAMAAQGGFALHWGAHGLRYGIPATVRADLAAGRDMLANLSRGALPAAKAQFDPFVTIHLTARRDVLAQRLAARGRETTQDIARRLARADYALPVGITAQTIDNSGDLDSCVKAVLRLLYPVKA
ncbi:phosphonate metabolism protein/1,5-bisphosphokinase (PRPP-forming) PhnN [Yoonia vestfoldensis]|jgi:ribose 1,5-bisphosphokinase|uniref:Ribose 1,5-bisphosphate phosphokinase PhnN n=1 Tax=Yoonia vestfoldensis TaxID=245188 RepID=A0A1Y0ECH3_9RHOB|nr:phosphonate metabolism protein/1,5-bisphosphokinase (PRPP-forming) PhnN [Yoonia vestfoldensis]ARU01263.1 ribose 1,5-bisphosphate phosphokinase PhnN [Yoonia vestfoldensis]